MSFDFNMAGSPVISAPASRHARSRTQSLSSDRPSTTETGNNMPPLHTVFPEAAFIAASAASQIVTADHDGHSQIWYDDVGIEPSGETALVSSNALQLANNFIDQLLFNIIAAAKSTHLPALRSAVSDVLKPKLAKDAINSADEELREYLGGGDIDDFVPPPDEENPRKWDLELSWKRTRLRCMVYSSLGDMEEDDEDYYMEQEYLGGNPDDGSSALVTPGVAIFLTSILEFMAEQVLVVAGQATFNRMRVRYEKDLAERTRMPGDVSERIIVQELDMERVALDRTLGRLWRSWKKRIRSPPREMTSPVPTTTSHTGNHAGIDSGNDSTDNPLSPSLDVVTSSQSEHQQSSSQIETDPVNVPLPMTDNDIAEIEVPGLVVYSEDDMSEEEQDDDQIPWRRRPLSWIPLTTTTSFGGVESKEEGQTMPCSKRQRSKSLPISGSRKFKSLPVTEPPEPLIVAGKENESPPTREPVLDVPQEPAQGSEEPKSDAAETTETVQKPDSPPRSDTLSRSASVTAVGGKPKFRRSVPDPLNLRPAKVEETSLKNPVSPLSKLVFGATALGSTTAAATNRNSATLQPTSPDTSSNKNEPISEKLREEPRVFITSRQPGDNQAASPPEPQHAGTSSHLNARSNSVRTVRMADVHHNRSPSVKSRSGSIDAPDQLSHGRSTTPREVNTNISATPIWEEKEPEAPISKPITTRRNAPHLNLVEEPVERKTSPHQHTSSSTRDTKPITPSTTAPAPSVSSYPSGSTKTTVLTLSTSNGSGSDSLQRTPVHSKAPLLPTLPEKNGARPYLPSPGAMAVPVDRDRNRPVSRGQPESPVVTARSVLSDSPSSKYKGVRSSSEENAQTAPRPEDVARNFEELLQNDQTLQYTLTPENMRNIDVGQSTKLAAASARTLENSTRVLHNGTHAPKSRHGEESKTHNRSRSSSLKRQLSLTKSISRTSHATSDMEQNGKLAGPVPRAPPGLKPSEAIGQARDARVPRESMQDFAEFIRSTGPSGERAAGMAHRTVTAGSANAATQDFGPLAPVSKSLSIDSTRHNPNRARLMARDAAVGTANDSSDLIDFLRRGPPSTGANPKYPRNLPSSRDTMDGHAGDVRSSQASNSVAGDSQSINSQSALLSKANRPTGYNSVFDSEDVMPKRKQPPIRDPYAIDLSDEEDDDQFMEPPPKARPQAGGGESILDFLKNYDPPPGSDATPLPFITAQTQSLLPKRKGSSNNLFTRLRGSGSGSGPRNGSVSSDAKSRANQISNGSRTGVRGGPGSPGSGSLSPRTDSTSREPARKFEPRDSVMAQTRTKDLSNFLRDSEPPMPVGSHSAAPTNEKNGGFSRMFGSRKKTVF